MIDPEKYLPPPFRLEGPEPPQRITAIGEAEKLERAAEVAKDEKRRAALLHRARCFRQLAQPDGLDWEMQVDQYGEEIDDRMKACLLLREHSIMADVIPLVRIEQHIQQLTALAETGDASEKSKAATELFNIAETATRALGCIVEGDPELIRPIAETANFFPINTNEHNTAEAKRRRERLKKIGLGTKAPAPFATKEQYTQLKSLVRRLFDYLRCYGGDKTAVRAFEMTGQEAPGHIRLLAGIDPSAPDKGQWKAAALEILRYSYGGSLANLPPIKGISKQPAKYTSRIKKKHAELTKKWTAVAVEPGSTFSVYPFPLPPATEAIRCHESWIARHLGNNLDLSRCTELMRDAQEFEALNSEEELLKAQEVEAAKRISETWDEIISV